jgi:hypothetical protein
MLLARQTRQLISKCFDFLQFCTSQHTMIIPSNHPYFDEVSKKTYICNLVSERQEK